MLAYLTDRIRKPFMAPELVKHLAEVVCSVIDRMINKAKAIKVPLIMVAPLLCTRCASHRHLAVCLCVSAARPG